MLQEQAHAGCCGGYNGGCRTGRRNFKRTPVGTVCFGCFVQGQDIFRVTEHFDRYKKCTDKTCRLRHMHIALSESGVFRHSKKAMKWREPYANHSRNSAQPAAENN